MSAKVMKINQKTLSEIGKVSSPLVKLGKSLFGGGNTKKPNFLIGGQDRQIIDERLPELISEKLSIKE